MPPLLALALDVQKLQLEQPLLPSDAAHQHFVHDCMEPEIAADIAEKVAAHMEVPWAEVAETYTDPPFAGNEVAIQGTDKLVPLELLMMEKPGAI